MRVETIGNATLYLGDCREILPGLAKPDLVLSDPPYGQRQKTNIRQAHLPDAGRHRPNGGRNVRRRGHLEAIEGDDQPFDPAWLLEAAPLVLLWGAHVFGHALPGGGQALVWDKRPNGKVTTHGDGEVAWLSKAGPLRIFRHLWDGLSIAAGYETKIERKGAAAAPRVHPTQKPVDLMLWCLDRCGLRVGSMVADPYMGGGSTGIAALIAGMRFTGIEIEPRYFDAACRRIERAHKHVEAHAAQSLLEVA